MHDLRRSCALVGDMALTLDSLLAPIGREVFFNDHWERHYAHLSGVASRALLTHSELLAALSPDTADIVVFPEHFATALKPSALLADRALLADYLDAGHPLIWNRCHNLFPAVDAVTATLAATLGAQVWPNLYSTTPIGTAFDTHFDAHEVFAIQCEGYKQWTLSEVRINRPLDVSAMVHVVARELRTRRHEAAARTQATFTAAPGDVVYIPRGQFHNARAVGQRSLHVTFGVRLPTGYDLLVALANEALADPTFREYLPPACEEPRNAIALARVIERITTLASPKRLFEMEPALREVLRSRLR